ncbi:MAG: bifunctional diguanylate cyclase/phosphodiesterase [Novosphingobium sp.]
MTARHMIVQTVSTLAMALILFGKVATAAIVAWLAMVVLSYAFSQGNASSSHEHRVRRMGTVLSALVWAFPLWVFGSKVGPEAAIQMWSVLAVLMAASVLETAGTPNPAPASAGLFSGIVGLCGAVWFACTAEARMAAIATLFAAITLTAIIEQARAMRNSQEPKGPPVGHAAATTEPGEADPGDTQWRWQTDAALRLRMISPRFACGVGREPADLEGISLRRVIAGAHPGDYPSGCIELAERMKHRQAFCDLTVPVIVNRRTRWCLFSGEPHYHGDTFVGYHGTGRDVTEDRESREKMDRMAHYDALTGLPNRANLTEALASGLGRTEPRQHDGCAFVMIDLDRFKAVNDTLGHDVGDTLLTRVAERLREQVSDGEVCGRFSGDSFAVVVSEAADPGRVRALVERIIERLIQPYEIEQHTVFVGASAGWAIGPHDGSSADTIIRNADLALHRANEARGNSQCRYERTFHTQAEERRRLEIALRNALKHGELHLAFQPVVDANSETTISFEALLRWKSADFGPVSPEKFIPLAEETRLIIPIGEWVLHEACRVAATWPHHVRIAVNVSGEQLLDANFVSSVLGALTASGLAPDRLEIEVTESIFLSDATRACAALEHVMALGCTVALDDFGTGYSSLGYLRRMRFSTIKLDRSFVHGAATGNRECRAILQAVVTMAESLGMATTAEGVETRRELDLVRTLGCRKIQGYYFGKPLDAGAAQASLERVAA